MSVTYLPNKLTGLLINDQRSVRDLFLWNSDLAAVSAKFPFALGDDSELTRDSLTRRVGGVVAALAQRHWNRVSIDVSADADGLAAVLACLIAGVSFTTERRGARGCEILPIDAHPSADTAVMRVCELADCALDGALDALDGSHQRPHRGDHVLRPNAFSHLREMISLFNLDQRSVVLTWLSPNTTSGWSLTAAACLVGGTVTVIDGMRFCVMSEPWFEYAQRIGATHVAIPVPQDIVIDCGASVHQQRFAGENLRVLNCGSLPVLLQELT
jgi:hypothetical protein